MEPLNNSEGIVESSKFEKISFYLILALTFLFPVFFLPAGSFPFELTKIVFGSILALAAAICYTISRIREGSVTVMKNPLVISLALIPFVFAISAIFSNNRIESFIGFGYEVGTVSFIALGVITALLIPLLARTKERILKIYTAFLVSFVLVAIYHIARFVLGPDFLTFGLFGAPTSNFIGKWNDLASFIGLAGLLSFLTIEFLSVNGLVRKLLYAGLIVSLVLLTLINFTLGWIALGVSALIVFLYQFLKKDHSVSEEGISSPRRPMSILAIVLIVLSLVMVFLGDKITAPIVSSLEISQIEVRPSWKSTIEIAGNTLKESPILGAGPNRFLGEFLKFKPSSVNQSVFWNTEFHYGVGLIPTFIVTTGLFGLLAWLLFFIFYIRQGIKVLTTDASDSFTKYILLSSFISSLFLWILAIFYIPSGVTLMLTFIMTGVFIAALALDHRIDVVTHDSLKSTRGGVIMVYLLIVFVIVGVVWGAIYAKQVIAGMNFQKSIAGLNSGGSIDEAELTLVDATKWADNDLYYQSLIEIVLIKMNQLIATADQSNQADAVKKLEVLLTAAISHAQAAIAIDPENYQNWISTGRIYEAVVPLQVPGAYEAASNAYNQALQLNPTNPGLYLLRARLEIANNNLTDAKQYIGKALELKGNYTDAVFLLSQIQVQEGNLKEAIRSVEAAAQISPNDPTIYFQLGILKYNDRNYLGTVDAMSKAVALNEQYSNARYFLGLSQARLGKTAEAIAQFETIKALNPDNSEIDTILQNLRAGRQPLANLEEPQPETRKALPVAEEKQTTTKKSSI